MEKRFGPWTDIDEACKHNTCGGGTTKQNRTCIDGTTEKCTEAETERTVICRDASTDDGQCVKELGLWVNEGNCIAIGGDISCGPGNQRQTRTCVDGELEKCTDILTIRTIECSDAGTTLPNCKGT